MTPLPALALVFLAQFTPTLLQNRSYWGDGKAEFDLYNAEFIRDGEKHSAELLMIFTPEFVDPTTFTRSPDAKTPGALPTIRMNMLVTLPRGLVIEQRSIMAVWRMDSMSLARLRFTGSDATQRANKSVDADKQGWRFTSDTSGGKVDNQSLVAPASGAVCFYDELPLRVRTLDFAKPAGEMDVQLAPTIATMGKDLGASQPAKISWKAAERNIDVEVTHSAGKDHFVLDAQFPFLLRDWQMADGSRLRMKNSIKVDYWNYLKNGDRERALKDPMLRHPD